MTSRNTIVRSRPRRRSLVRRFLEGAVGVTSNSATKIVLTGVGNTLAHRVATR
jgi:hypothetical protein